MRLGRPTVIVVLLALSFASHALGASIQVVSVKRDLWVVGYTGGLITKDDPEFGIKWDFESIPYSDRFSSTEPLTQFQKTLSGGSYLEFADSRVNVDYRLSAEVASHQNSQILLDTNQYQIEASGYVDNNLKVVGYQPHLNLEVFGIVRSNFEVVFDVTAPVHYTFDADVEQGIYQAYHGWSLTGPSASFGGDTYSAPLTFHASGVLQPGRYTTSIYIENLTTDTIGPRDYRMKLSMHDVAAVSLPASVWAGGAMMGALALAKGFRKLRRA